MSLLSNPADIQAAASGRDEEYLLTGPEARIATTLALMTGFSQGCCALHRAPMAGRVAEELARMAHGPELSVDMRDFLRRMCQRWSGVAQALEEEAREALLTNISASSNHWHHSPDTLQ